MIEETFTIIKAKKIENIRPNSVTILGAYIRNWGSLRQYLIFCVCFHCFQLWQNRPTGIIDTTTILRQRRTA